MEFSSGPESDDKQPMNMGVSGDNIYHEEPSQDYRLPTIFDADWQIPGI